MSVNRPDIVVRDLLANDARVRALARHLVADEHLAEDIVQDAWVTALERPPARAGSFKAWLERVVRNLVLMRERSAGRRREHECVAARPVRLPALSELREHEEIRRRVVETVFSLEEPYQSAVLYRFFRDLPPRAIAAELGVPVETVKKRILRGLEKLRARLDDGFEDRSSWRAALSSVAAVGGATSAAAGSSVVTGALLMGTKLKLAAVVVALVCGTAFVLWPDTDQEPPTPPAGETASRPIVAETPKERGASPADAPERPADSAPVVPEKAPVVAPPVALDVARGAIVGRVVDASRAPIAGASVRALRLVPGGTILPAVLSTTTDRDGGYALKPVRVRLVVEVSAAGHYTDRRVVEPFTRADFTLGAPGALAGTLICAPDRSPCVDAIVALYPWRPSQQLEQYGTLEFAWTRPPVAVTRSGTDGGFRFGALRPGRYRVRVVPRARPEIGDAGRVAEVRAGAEARLDVVVRRGIRIAGRVTDEETGKPVAGALVSTLRRDRPPVITDADGRYELTGIEATPFLYQEIRVLAEGYAPHARQLARRETGRHDVKLKPGVVIGGRVVGADGEPVAGARVGTASFVVGPWSVSSRMRYPPALTDDDGRFAWRTRRSDAERRIHALKDGLGWAVSEPFRTTGASHDGIVVRLPRAGSVGGRVRTSGGEAVVGARVSLFEDRAFRAETFSATGGEYELPAVSPGEYTVYVLPPGTPLEYDSPLTGLSRTGVRVAAGRRTDVDLTLQLGPTIAGEVVDTQGRPLEGVVVRAACSAGAELLANFGGRPPRMRQTATDDQGRFVVRGLTPERTYYLVAKRDGHERAFARGIQPGRDDVRIEMAEQRVVRGRILAGATGEPVIEFRLRGASVPAGDERRKPIRFPRPTGRFTELDGRFRFPLEPGRYTLVAETMDGQRSDEHPFVVPQTGDPEPIELRVWPGASIVGEVRSRTGSIRYHGSLTLYDLGVHPARWVRNAQIDDTGQIDVRPLPPGRFLLVATASLHDGTSAEGTLVVDVAARAEHRVSVVVGARAPVEVAVTDRRDRPIAGATVTINRPDGASIVMNGSSSLLYRRIWDAWLEKNRKGSREAFNAEWLRARRALTVTGSDGRLAPLVLVPGEYVIESAADGHAADRRTVRIRPGTNTVRITLD